MNKSNKKNLYSTLDKSTKNDIYNSIVVKDIIERFGIKDLDLFNRIVEYVVTTLSQNFLLKTLDINGKTLYTSAV